MSNQFRSVVWDIETASADDLHSYGPGYVRLVGYQVDNEDPVVTTDVNELLGVLQNCDRHYSFNGLAFDCVALALHHGVDYYELTRNAVDLMLVERQVNPPRAKTNYPKKYWGLDQTAKRYGHTGKTDDLVRLAAEYGGFDKIPVDNEEYVSYTYGDIETTKFLADRIGPEYDRDPYLPEEHETMRRMYYGARIRGFRVDVDELERRREEQRIRKERNFRKLQEKFDIPLRVREVTEFSNPFRVQEGKDWFDTQCTKLGIESVPRTAKGAASLTSKNVEKLLRNQTHPDTIDFLSCVIGAMGDDKDSITYLHSEFGLPLERVEIIETKTPLRTKRGVERLEELFSELGASRVRRTESTRQISTTKDDLRAAVEFYSDPERQREKRMVPMSPENLERFSELVEVIIDVTTERTVYDTIHDHLVGDRVYPKITPKQASGRWSVTEPGLTVLGKRGGKHTEREVFLPDDDDEVLIAVDLDQVDARGIAGHSQDPEYAKFFEPGKDLHSEVSLQVFGKVTPELRDASKALGHAINYGQGPKGAAANAGIDLEIAYEFNRNYSRSFRILERWKGRVRDQASAGYLLDNGFGRKMKADPARAYTQAPALMGQGATRDIMAKWIKRLDLDCVLRIKAVVHDEVIFSVPRSRVEEYREKILAAATFDFKGIPITAGCSEPATTWGGCYG